MSIVRWTQRRFPVPIWMKLRASRFQDSTTESLVLVVGIRSEKAGMMEYGKRATNTPVRQAGYVLKCPDDRKNTALGKIVP